MPENDMIVNNGGNDEEKLQNMIDHEPISNRWGYSYFAIINYSVSKNQHQIHNYWYESFRKIK